MSTIRTRFRSITKPFKYGLRLRPVRDWLVLLAFCLLLLLVSVGWNLWLFSEVTQGKQIGTATSTPAVEIKLDQVQTLFGERAQERARYENEYRFVDPSL